MTRHPANDVQHARRYSSGGPLATRLLGARLTFRLLSPTILALSLACAGARPVEVTPVYRDGESQFMDARRELVRDAATWQVIWDSSGSHGIPTPPPEIDFARYMLLVAAGPNGGSGDSLVVDSLVERSGAIRGVAIRYETCAPLLIAGSPIDVLRLPRSNARLELVERRVRGEWCP